VVTALSANTLRAYRSDWADFEAWCGERRRRALPATPATVAAYVEWSGRLHRASTVHRRLAAITFEHERSGLVSPCQHRAVRAADALCAWNDRGRASSTVPATVDDVVRIVDTLDDSVAGRRDRALVLVMLGAGLRRSQVSALDLDDVVIGRRSVRVSVPGRPVIVIPVGSRPTLCAVAAWRRWLDVRPDALGDLGPGSVPAFCRVDRLGRVLPGRISDRGVARIVTRSVIRAGLDPRRVTSRSLRVGLVVVAREKGVGDEAIMRQSGHQQARRVRELTRGR
jgi:site-specific recombinase XerD